MASYDDKQTDKALEELQQRIIENYQNAYDEISKTAADYWRDFMPRYNEERKAYEAGKGGYADEKTAKAKFDAWTLAQYGRGERWDNLRDKIATRLNDANKTASAYIKDTTPGIYELNANYSAYLIEEATGVDFTLYDERTVADLIQGKTQILPPSKVNDAKTNAYIQNQLTKAVTSGILQGQPIDKIAKQFERVTQMNANAAIRNARTAVTSAQNAGRQDTYERAAEMGIEIEKEWIATVDDRTRDSHAELDGVRVKIDELYPNGLNYPADPTGAPEEVYNCRCTQRAIIAKYNGQARETVIDGHEGTHTKATYEQWKADKIAAQPPTTHADATARAMEAKEDAQEAAAEEMAAAEPEITIDAFDNLGLKSETVEAMDQILKDCKTPELRDFYQANKDKLNVIDNKYKGTAHYSPGVGGVYVSEKKDKDGSVTDYPYEALYHEFAHNLDHQIASEKTDFISTIWRDNDGKSLYDIITSDYKNLAAEVLNGEKAKKSETSSRVIGFLQNELGQNPKALGIISDVIECQTGVNRPLKYEHKDGIYEYAYGFGHGSSYWTKGYYGREAKGSIEFFAEACESMAVNPEALAALETYFPNALEACKQIMRDNT